ncbi:MAG: hypothetical protein J6R80_05455 [Kiritimatiellae bacterium]|nr:hypothetical protein [Kiritimatiellia bacterium]
MMKKSACLCIILNAALILSATAYEKRPLRYFKIIPVRHDHIDFAISEAKRQAKLGVKEFAASLSYHPQCLPPKDLLPKHAEAFRKFKAGLEGTGITVGVLIQSTQGHAARSVDVHWQRSILANGAPRARFCMLDKEFREYVLSAIRSICREDPAFLLIDDDFGPRAGEGFCPLHAELYNEATGESRTASEWGAFVSEAPASDPIRIKVEASRIAAPVSFAKEIRAAIDSVNPSIRCGYSTPGQGIGFAKDVALALAGPRTRPFLRLNNSVYGMNAPRTLIGQQRTISRLLSHFEGIDEIVSENDTWPQNYWSESAKMFSAHLTLGILYGVDGGKIWMSEFDRTIDTHSQSRYEQVFSKYLPMRQALYDLVRTKSPRFRGITAFVNSPSRLSDSVKPESINYASGLDDIFLPMGFPCSFAKADRSHPHDIYILVKKSIKLLSDEELAQVLSHRVIVDSLGAKELVSRGFGADICASVTDYKPNEVFNTEVFADGTKVRWQSDATNVRLEAAEGAKTLSRFVNIDSVNGTSTEMGAGLILGTNARGGRVMVMGWTYDCQGWNRWNKYLRPVRKEILIKAIDRLIGGVLPYVCVENNHTLSSYATLDDGSELVAVTNFGDDDWQELALRLGTKPLAAKRLTYDGSWEEISFEKEGDVVKFKTGEVRPLTPQILLITPAP